MSIFGSMNVSVSGLEANRARLEAASLNLANAESSAPQGAPVFSIRRVNLEETAVGVRYETLATDQAPRLELDPGHPDAGPDGMVRYPNVDVVAEMAELMSSRRTYEANLAAYSEAKAMFSKALEIGRA